MEEYTLFMSQRFSIVKMSILPSHRSISMQSQSPSRLFCRNRQADSKIHMEIKTLTETKKILKKEQQ